MAEAQPSTSRDRSTTGRPPIPRQVVNEAVFLKTGKLRGKKVKNRVQIAARNINCSHKGLKINKYCEDDLKHALQLYRHLERKYGILFILLLFSICTSLQSILSCATSVKICIFIAG